MMGNTVQSMWKDMKLKYIFDLKGSLINRETKVNMKKHKPSMTLKDINLLTIRQSENILKFSLNDRVRIMDILERDVHILNKHKIMDYSLLLAIENNQLYTGKSNDRTSASSSQLPSVTSEDTPKLGQKFSGMPQKDSRSRLGSSKSDQDYLRNRYTEFFQSTRHRFMSYSGEYIYHIAIIDYLQEFNWDKKSEHFAKSIFRGRGAEISAVPPVRYMKRYVEFMRNEVIISANRDESTTFRNDSITDDKNRGKKS